MKSTNFTDFKSHCEIFFLLGDKHICYKEIGVHCTMNQTIKISKKKKRKFSLIFWV